MGWKKLEKTHDEALRLRVDERQSIGFISRALKISKSTLSLWLRDCPLTQEEIRRKSGYRLLVSEKANCRVCGAEFQRTNIRKKSCSDSCRNKFSSEFRNRKRRTNGERVVSWRQRVKKRAVEYKGGKCAVCGYSRSIRALKFHHIDPEEKDFGISQRIKSWETVQLELDKCLLVCGNCHDEIHDGLVDLAPFANSQALFVV